MNIRFYNARILTMANDLQIEDGELWVSDGKVSYVGPGSQNKDNTKWDREINAGGNLLMPGFKNAHTHSAMTFLRSFADDLPLEKWLTEKVFPMEGKFVPDHMDHFYTFAKIAIMEYLTSGITACADMYLSPDHMAKAAMDTGFRTVLVGAVNNFVHTPRLQNMWYQKYNHPDSLVTWQIGFHAVYTTSEEILREIAAMAHHYQVPVCMHNSETVQEVYGCIQNHNMTPTAWMDQLGLFEYGGTCYHCVHMTPPDLEIMKKRGISIVTNPGSNLKLASGIAPVTQFLESGLNVAIGTDGAGSNNCLDMFREMFLVSGLAKYKEKDSAAVPAGEVLKMATLGGARAMGLKDCDTLEPGKKADLIMIDLQQPNMQPMNHIVKNIVYSGSKSNVKMTMVDGKILYENGKFYIGEEPFEIYERANKVMEEIG